MKRLIVIEGFDRCGKDTLLEDLEKYCKKKYLKEVYVFKNDLEGLPKYDKEQGEFLVWLNKYIEKQVDKLNELFETYDTVIMSRFLVSDEVYSALFNRENTTIKYINRLSDDIELNTFCLLFKNYEEYLQRLQMIGDTDIQYTKDEFDRINNLYVEKASDFSDCLYFRNVLAKSTREEILKDFLEIY